MAAEKASQTALPASSSAAATSRTAAQWLEPWRSPTLCRRASRCGSMGWNRPLALMTPPKPGPRLKVTTFTVRAGQAQARRWAQVARYLGCRSASAWLAEIGGRAVQAPGRDGENRA